MTTWIGWMFAVIGAAGFLMAVGLLDYWWGDKAK